MNDTQPHLKPLVLLIDDDQTLHIWADRYLSKAGFKVIGCLDGRTGMEVFEQNAPDIVLVDIDMPVLDGFTVCRAIRLLDQGRNIPILMMTVTEDAQDIAEAYSVGATDFVVKPINWEILTHRLYYMAKAGMLLTKLELSERRLTKAKQMARLGDWEWRLEDGAVHWSEEIYALVEITHPAFTPNADNYRQFVHPDDLSHVNRAIQIVLRRKSPSTVEFRLITAHRKELTVSQHIEAMTNRQGKFIGLTGTVQDITERKNNENRIRHLAYYDEVTQLPNRIFFLEYLAKTIKLAMRGKKIFAILFLDLDGFKGINDSYGHQAGDRLLYEISQRLTTGLRCSDVTSRYYDHIDHKVDVARLGGDEFTVLLNELARPEDAAVVAERIHGWLTQPVTLGDRQVRIGVSIGITIFPNDGDNAETLLRNADMAMYHAKRLGKGHYQFFQQEMALRAKKRLEMESHMHLAVPRNELLLHFQPVIDCGSEQLSGAEALLRWQSPELGYMPPNDFISFAEENGMINQFGEWVIRKVCCQLAIWQGRDWGELSVAINLSAMQFNQPGFIPMIAEIIQEYRINPGAISFELTESMLMLDTDNMMGKLKQLKNLGFKLAIDDFGTGYSSLNYLKRFPLDCLKIDRSFIKDLPRNKDSAAIVNAVLALARALNLKTVAEGVETEAQKLFLYQAGCDAIQGYYFSKPLPISDFEAYWANKNLVIQ